MSAYHYHTGSGRFYLRLLLPTVILQGLVLFGGHPAFMLFVEHLILYLFHLRRFLPVLLQYSVDGIPHACHLTGGLQSTHTLTLLLPLFLPTFPPRYWVPPVTFLQHPTASTGVVTFYPCLVPQYSCCPDYHYCSSYHLPGWYSPQAFVPIVDGHIDIPIIITSPGQC